MRAWCAAVCALLALASSAIADDDTPWSKGVSEEQKANAQRLLEQGNEYLFRNELKDALAKYQEAVAAWDHPAIRFNMVRALISLDRPLEAYENLEKTLQYGAAPLEENIYREAVSYQHLLEGQLAILEVKCSQQGVKISVDGAAFLSCPGTKSTRVTTGTHAVVGTKEGFLTKTFDAVLVPGKAHPIDVQLIGLGETHTRTRWATWKPWVVAGSGAALIGAGVVLELRAQSTADDYDRYLRACPPIGCNSNDQMLSDTKSRAVFEDRLAIGTMIAGGATLATGVVLLVMNRPVAYVPEVSTTGAGVSVSGKF